MKRFVTMLLAVTMMLSCLPVVSLAATDTTTQSTDMVMDFDGWSSLDGHRNQDGDVIETELFTRSGSDKAVRMTTPSTPTANVGVMMLLPDERDWSDGVGLQMYVKNLSETAQLAFSPRFECARSSDGLVDLWMPIPDGVPCQLISGDTVTAATSLYGFVFLPAGFEGYVRIPFASFCGGWRGSKAEDMNLSGAGLIRFTFDTNGYRDMSLVVDEVSVIKPCRKGNVEDFHGWFANSITAEANIGAKLVNSSIRGQALKLSIDSADGYNYAAFSVANKDWSKGNVLQMYVENLTAGTLTFQPRFWDSNSTDLWQPTASARVRFVEDGIADYGVNTNGFVTLPEGFEGYVQIPLSDFVGSFYGTPNEQLDVSAVGSNYIFFDAREGANNVGKSLLLDEISIVKELAELDVALVESFEKWTDTAKITAHANIGTALVDNGSLGSSLKLSIDSADGYNTAFFNPANKDWSKGQALQLYIKNLSDEQLAFRLDFYGSNGSQLVGWNVAADAPVQYVQDDIVTAGKATYGFLWLPAAFEGYLQIPFDSYVSGDNTLDLSAATGGMTFLFDAREGSSFIGAGMLVDDIRLLEELPEVTPEPEPEPEDENRIESFNTWTDISKITYAQDPVSAKLVRETLGDNALQITVTGAEANGVNIGMAGFTPTNRDWNGKAGLQVYMENPASSNLVVKVSFIAGGEMWSASNGTAIKRVENGTIWDGTLVYGFVNLPANFKGYVRLPFSAFQGGWYGTANEKLDLSAVTNVYFSFDTNPNASYIGKSVVIDDLYLIDSLLPEDAPTAQENLIIIENKLKALQDVVPEVTYIPAYDPVSSPSGENQWDHIKALTFDGATIGDNKTKVFAYIGYPENATEKSPAVVLVHGGAGHPFAQWIKEWTDRGYVAIAFENTGYFPTEKGKGVAGREGDPTSYWAYGLSEDFAEEGYVNAPTNSGLQDTGSYAETQWMYHCMAQTILAHNILRNDEAVDSSKIGVTGVSWGGLITSLVTGFDDRYSFAIPVYCCGYSDEALGNMSTRYNTDSSLTLWSAQDRFDRVTYPVLWLTGNSDYSCSVISASKSYLDTKYNHDKTALALLSDLPHSHTNAWSKEISYRFADWAVKDGAGLAKFETEPSGRNFSVSFTAPEDATSVSAKLYYITEQLSYSSGGAGKVMDQTWKTMDCTVSNSTVSCQVPEEAHSYYVELTVSTQDGDFVTTSSFVEADKVAECVHHYTYTDNGDGTHDRTCNLCGAVSLDDEAHDFQEGLCVCGAEEMVEETPDLEALENAKVTVTATAEPVSGGSILSWEAVANATGYEVYSASGKSGSYSLVEAVEGTELLVEVAPGKTRYFKVRAVYEDGDIRVTSTYSDAVKVVGKCATVAVYADHDGETGKVQLRWEKISGAKKYDVYRATSADGKYTKLTTTSKTYYTDPKGSVGVTYFYKVRGVASSSSYNGQFCEPVSAFRICGMPKIGIKLDAATGKPVLSWEKVSGAAQYQVFRLEEGTGEYRMIAEQTEVRYTDYEAPVDTLCSYAVVACGSEDAFDSFVAEKSVQVALARPEIAVSLGDVSGKPVITWEAVEDAVEYIVYRSTSSSKSYKAVATVVDTEYVAASAAVGKSYYYKVVAVGENSKSAYSSYKKAVAKCAQPQVTADTDIESGKPVVRWEKVSGAKKYYVYRVNEDGTMTRLTSTTKTSYIHSKAVVGESYTYVVRAIASSSSRNSIDSVPVVCRAVCGRPTLKVRIHKTTGKPSLSWTAVSGAVGYEIYRLNEENTYIKIASTAEQEWLDETAVVDVHYTYAVVAFAQQEGCEGVASEAKTAAAKCGQAIVSAELQENKPLVQWNEVEGAVKYYVYRSTSKSSGYKKVAEVDEESYHDTGAKKGKTYYYKIVAVSEASKGEYSSYVKIKSK